MERTLSEMEAIIREKICGVCSDRTADGDCGLAQPGECALFRLFPQVVEAIRTTDSERIEDYISAIRSQVCSLCEDEASDGSCERRHKVQCALDAYLLLIVDAIEEVTAKTFDRSSVGKKPKWIAPIDNTIH